MTAVPGRTHAALQRSCLGVLMLAAALMCLAGLQLFVAPTGVAVGPDGPSLTLTQESTRSDVDGTLVLTATVTGCAGADVTFVVVDGPNAGAQITQSADGAASYVGLEEGTDTIEASFRTYAGDTVADQVSHQWTEPPPAEVVVTLTGPATASIGDSVSLTASVEGSTGGPVSFFDGERDIATVQAPPYQTTFSPETAGDHTLTAVYTAPNGQTHRSAELAQRWLPSVTLDVTWDGTRDHTFHVGDWASLSATVRGGDATSLDFQVTGPNASLLKGDKVGSEYWNGYEGKSPGTDTVKALATTPWGPVDSKVTVVWHQKETPSEAPSTSTAPPLGTELSAVRYRPGLPGVGSVPGEGSVVVCNPSLTLEPDGQTSTVATDFTVTATVREDGQPLPGVPVTVTATMPGSPTLTLAQTQQATGPPPAQQSFTDTRDHPGTDTLTATVAAPGFAPATLLHTWIDPDHPSLTVTLGPDGVSTVVGRHFTVTAVVSNEDGDLVADAEVDFTASLPGAPDIEGPPSDADGIPTGTATFDYTRHTTGEEHVVATASANGLTGSATITHEWQDVSALTLNLAPDHRTSTVGSEFTAVAHLERDRQPLRDAKLDFAVTSENGPAVSGSSSTAEDGRARFTYGRGRPGVDDVVVTYTNEDGTQVQAGIVHIWRAGDRVGPGTGGSGTGDPGPEGSGPEGSGPEPQSHGLQLAESSVSPGADDGAGGYGCPAGVTVDITMDGGAFGTTSAAVGGTYQSRLHIPQTTPLGDYTVQAVCGDVVSSAPLSVAVSSSATGTTPASLVTSGAVLSFFILLGGQLLRLGGTPSAAPPGG